MPKRKDSVVSDIDYDENDDIDSFTDIADDEVNDIIEENSDQLAEDTLNDDFNQDDIDIENDDISIESLSVYSDYEDEDERSETPHQDEKRVPNDERISKPYLTKYELARVIGTRTRQIILGAKKMVTVQTSNGTQPTPRQIAVEELLAGKIPFIIRRPRCNDTFEYWRVSELEMDETRIREMIKN